VGSGWHTKDSKQWVVDTGQWAVISKLWADNNGQFCKLSNFFLCKIWLKFRKIFYFVKNVKFGAKMLLANRFHEFKQQLLSSELA
jgi:hypothetical protein